MVRSLFLTMRVAGYIAYLSRLGGGTEPNATISPLLGFTQPTESHLTPLLYRLKKPLYMSARFPMI
ncbi:MULTISPECIES: hypothetical protein [Limnospira]|uniref:Uncharacterized protein n=1 Tax=Limnospira fusiformis PMC 851.14 TaxID=2219512 RepID=A0ABU9EM19_LIMFS|nr:hypothetical protein [Limnospira indica]